MKDLTPKFDNTGGPTGQLDAADFNINMEDLQNAVTKSGQTLDATGTNLRQLLMAIATGGERVSRADTETALIGEIVVPDNSSAALTINLPPTANLFIGATLFFEQEFDQLYSTFSLTLGRNSNNIFALAEDFVMNSSGSDNTLIAVIWVGGSTGWKILVVGSIGTTL